MSSTRNLAVGSFAAVVVILFSSTAAFADHLDRVETKRIVRQLEERSDAVQDRIDSWISLRREEREHRAEGLVSSAENFDQMVAQFKLDLYKHDEPWDLRDNAQKIIDAATEFGRTVEHSELHDDLRGEWEQMRESANALARHYHLAEAVR